MNSVITDDTCPEKMQVFQNHIWVREEKCALPKGHPGLHQSAMVTWATNDKVQAIVENEGRSL